MAKILRGSNEKTVSDFWLDLYLIQQLVMVRFIDLEKTVKPINTKSLQRSLDF